MNADAKIHRESISLWQRDRSLSPHDLLCPRHTCGPLAGRSPPPPGASCPSPCRRPCWPGTSCRWGLAGCWAGSAPASSAGPSWSSHWSGTSSSAGTECSHHLRPRGCDGVGRWWLLWEDWHLSEGGDCQPLTVAHQGRATGDYWAADTTDYTDRVWRFIMTYAEYCTVLICPLQWEIESARECGSCAWLINFPTAISQNEKECQWCK